MDNDYEESEEQLDDVKVDLVSSSEWIFQLGCQTIY